MDHEHYMGLALELAAEAAGAMAGTAPRHRTIARTKAKMRLRLVFFIGEVPPWYFIVGGECSDRVPAGQPVRLGSSFVFILSTGPNVFFGKNKNTPKFFSVCFLSPYGAWEIEN